MPRSTAIATAVLLGTTVACSHLTPYYRYDHDQTRVVAAPLPAAIDHRIILIGDTGDPSPQEPVLQTLAVRVRLMPERTTAVFLGDIVYERGMPEAITSAEKPLDVVADVMDRVLPDVLVSREEAERQMRAQLVLMAGTEAQALFVAGNHDWDQFEPGGWKRILALQSFIKDEAAAVGANVTLVPSGGCPGPVAVPIGKRATVIALDTQWWLETREDEKPTTNRNPTGCPYVTEEKVRERLVTDLEAAARAGRWAIVAAHHPLETRGAHSGFVDVRNHFFPLRIFRHYLPFWQEWLPIPLIGSAAIWLRQCCSPSVQDISNRRNRHMRRMLEHSLREAERKHAAPLLFAAGHDHCLQVFEGRNGPRFTLVSGMGSRVSGVGHNARTLFAHSNPFHPGFMEIDFLTDGSARLAVIEHDKDKPEGVEVFSMMLAKGKPGR